MYTFPAKAVVELNGEFVSDHSRSPLAVSYEVIEEAARTVSGSMRIYSIAKKHNLSMSWDLLPSISSYTVDGGLGGRALMDLYLSTIELNVRVWIDAEAKKSERDPTLEFDGRMKEFSYEVVKRNIGSEFSDLWNVNLTIEEF